MTEAIELTLRIEGETVTVLQIKKTPPETAPKGPATPADTLDQLINSLAPGLSPTQPPTQPPAQPSTQPPSPQATRAQYPTISAARRLQQQIENELAHDNQRICIRLISCMSQSMMTDESGTLGRARAEQVFGMLELAELLDLDPEMSQFLEHHHAALLYSLR